jgi:hypothetical protein
MNRKLCLIAVLCAGFSYMGMLSEATSANLLRNQSFEQTPCVTPCNRDQGFMPSDWLSLNVTPDTYSNDGSYGLAPSDFGNFTGATAQDGLRWVAGWSAAVEIFGQILTSPLIPGQEYTLSAHLREAVRGDLAHPGTYQIELWDSADNAADKIVIGSFQPLIANQGAWELRTLAFTAPTEADTYSVLAFRPLGSDAGSAYPGVDNVVLEEAAQTCVQPPSGMRGWWPGDGNTSDILSDQDAVLHGNATTGPGIVSEGFLLDGDGDFVEVPNNPALNVGTGDFTIDLWVYFNSTDGEQVLVEKWVQRFGDPDPSVGWTFTKLADNHIGFFPGAETDPLNLPTNTWIHFAVRRQSGTVSIFVNGELKGEGFFDGNLDSLSSLKFGHRGSPNDTPGSQDTRGFYLNGRIDEVELFVGRALKDEEIQAIFAAGSAGKCKEPLATLWVGLKNSNDQGTQFDLRTEVYKGATLVAAGETRCITGVTRNPSKAKEVNVFDPVANAGFAPGDMLSLKVLTRIGTNPDNTKCAGPGGSHNNAVGLRLYYDAVSRPSRIGAEITPDPDVTDFFLHSEGADFFLDDTAPTATAAKFKDSAGVNFAGGNPWKEIGTWSMELP